MKTIPLCDSRSFPLSEVAARTGAAKRAIQFWVNNGALRTTSETDRAGTGVHRQFPVVEVAIAALLRPLAETGITIGELCRFSVEIRNALVFVQARLHDPRFRDKLRSNHPVLLADEIYREAQIVLERAFLGEGKNFLLLFHSKTSVTVNFVDDRTGDACANLSRAWADQPKGTRLIVMELTELLARLLA